MNTKSLHTLELPKILERLASFAAFSASKELARALLPTSDLSQAQRLLAETSEARLLLSQTPTLTIGGARDVRPEVKAATRGAVLEPVTLLDIKHTLLAGKTLQRTFEKDRPQFPLLSQVCSSGPPSKVR